MHLVFFAVLEGVDVLEARPHLQDPADGAEVERAVAHGPQAEVGLRGHLGGHEPVLRDRLALVRLAVTVGGGRGGNRARVRPFFVGASVELD